MMIGTESSAIYSLDAGVIDAGVIVGVLSPVDGLDQLDQAGGQAREGSDKVDEVNKWI